MAKPAAAAIIRDRIKEFRRVPTRELQDNPKNWRVHPFAQQKAVQELLVEVGIAGTLTAYNSARNGGKLTLIDGHMRTDLEEVDKWPVVILDVNDDEADLLLATLDPLRGLAETDASSLEALLADTHSGGAALDDLLGQLARAALANSTDDDSPGEAADHGSSGPAEMELQPFEHYDYVVLLFKTTLDWMQAQEKLGLKRVKFTLRDGKARKIGLGRVVDGAKVLARLK